jgi:hypothetical protein
MNDFVLNINDLTFNGKHLVDVQTWNVKERLFYAYKPCMYVIIDGLKMSVDNRKDWWTEFFVPTYNSAISKQEDAKGE